MKKMCAGVAEVRIAFCQNVCLQEVSAGRGPEKQNSALFHQYHPNPMKDLFGGRYVRPTLLLSLCTALAACGVTSAPWSPQDAVGEPVVLFGAGELRIGVSDPPHEFADADLLFL